MAGDLHTIRGSHIRLKKRAEFLAVARGRRIPRRGFVLQYALRHGEAGSPPQGEPARFGYTVTKKTGNSVERNRIRRRLREAVRLAGGQMANPAADHVLVGRREALSLPFSVLVTDLQAALQATQQPQRPKRSPQRTGP